ncbi:MAG: hypothetical protein CM15mP39_06280 [Synechococcus sp.]|nr:MAG: hypothetical protein CM15mP39_06280 [Synechococcus sp.]
MATDQNSFAKAVLDPNADRAPLLIGFQENRALLLGAVDELQRLPLLALLEAAQRCEGLLLDGAMTPMVNQLAWAIA